MQDYILEMRWVVKWLPFYSAAVWVLTRNTRKQLCYRRMRWKTYQGLCWPNLSSTQDTCRQQTKLEGSSRNAEKQQSHFQSFSKSRWSKLGMLHAQRTHSLLFFSFWFASIRTRNIHTHVLYMPHYQKSGYNTGIFDFIYSCIFILSLSRLEKQDLTQLIFLTICKLICNGHQDQIPVIKVWDSTIARCWASTQK